MYTSGQQPVSLSFFLRMGEPEIVRIAAKRVKSNKKFKVKPAFFTTQP